MCIPLWLRTVFGPHYYVPSVISGINSVLEVGRLWQQEGPPFLVPTAKYIIKNQVDQGQKKGWIIQNESGLVLIHHILMMSAWCLGASFFVWGSIYSGVVYKPRKAIDTNSGMYLHETHMCDDWWLMMCLWLSLSSRARQVVMYSHACMPRGIKIQFASDQTDCQWANGYMRDCFSTCWRLISPVFESRLAWW